MLDYGNNILKLLCFLIHKVILIMMWIFRFVHWIWNGCMLCWCTIFVIMYTFYTSMWDNANHVAKIIKISNITKARLAQKELKKNAKYFTKYKFYRQQWRLLIIRSPSCCNVNELQLNRVTKYWMKKCE